MSGLSWRGVFDAVIALLVTLVGVAETWVPFPSRAGSGSAVLTSVVTVAMGLALLARRRHPLPVLAGVVVMMVAAHLTGQTYLLFYGQFVPLTIALFSTARHGAGRVPYLGAATGAALLLFIDIAVEELRTPGEVVFHWGVSAAVWGGGYGLRRHEQLAEESTRRAVAAEVAAAERAMAAVLAERTRIARELHDIVAHSVSTMVVQAGAAEQVVDEDPELVRRALTAIRSTGADALGEMRRVVAVLRDDHPGGVAPGGPDEMAEQAGLSPQPGIDGVPALVEGARQSGLDVRLEVRGARTSMPPGLELTAYRVVQEALTNIRRHAEARCATVVLDHGGDELLVEVVDDGKGGESETFLRRGRVGHGLVGMQERVELYGGSLSVGPAARGGFRVRAALPLAPGSAARGLTSVGVPPETSQRRTSDVGPQRISSAPDVKS